MITKKIATILWGTCLMTSLPAIGLLPEPINYFVWAGLLATGTYFMGYKHALVSDKEMEKDKP